MESFDTSTCFYVVFISQNRSKPSRTKFRTILKCQRTKISATKMNFTIQWIHRILITPNVMCRRPQKQQQCIQMNRIIRWIERKMFIHQIRPSPIHLDQIKHTFIRRKSMKRRIMCMDHRDRHDHHHHPSIRPHHCMNAMWRIIGMFIIHLAAFQFIQIMRIYHHISPAQSKLICTKRKRPIQRTQPLSQQMVKNICHMIVILRNHRQPIRWQINIISIHQHRPPKIHTIGQNVNHCWLHSQRMAYIHQLKSMAHQNISDNWWLHSMRWALFVIYIYSYQDQDSYQWNFERISHFICTLHCWPINLLHCDIQIVHICSKTVRALYLWTNNTMFMTFNIAGYTVMFRNAGVQSVYGLGKSCK